MVGLELLHEELKAVLGISRTRRFVPHVTLLRDKRRLLRSMPIEPIEWTVSDSSWFTVCWARRRIASFRFPLDQSAAFWSRK